MLPSSRLALMLPNWSFSWIGPVRLAMSMSPELLTTRVLPSSPLAWMLPN